MESWFSDANVVRLPAELSGAGLGFTAPVIEEMGVEVGGIPMTAWLKIVAWRHAKQVSPGEMGGWARGSGRQCVR